MVSGNLLIKSGKIYEREGNYNPHQIWMLFVSGDDDKNEMVKQWETKINCSKSKRGKEIKDQTDDDADNDDYDDKISLSK